MGTELSELDEMLALCESASEDSFKREQEAADRVRVPSQYLKLNPGKNYLRILPAVKGDVAYVKVGQHWLPDLGNGRGGSLICPSTAGVGACPICNYKAELDMSSDPADQQQAGEIRAKLKVIYNAVNISAGDNRVVPFYATISMKGDGTHDRIQAQREQCIADGIPDTVVDPVHGRQICITVSTVAGYQNYAVSFANKATPCELDWMRQAKPVSSYAVIQSYQDLERYVAILKGEAPGQPQAQQRGRVAQSAAPQQRALPKAAATPKAAPVAKKTASVFNEDLSDADLEF